ncbi:hypothetical protein ACFPMF_05075 [Larkinella bovis]|uniref:Copper chaperone n=1 Tax=Larkinella bovis TaxID=683041 RepID=A0ABW0IBG7_9BACT
MVEVFKTDVQERRQANRLIGQINRLFSDYTVSFDLEDCDKILRVQSKTGLVDAELVIAILEDSGFTAEILPDDAPIGLFTLPLLAFTPN